MMVNEFGHGRVYDCGSNCNCLYDTALASQCKIDGKGVLAVYGYHSGRTGKWVGISIGILVAYRLLGWAVTAIKRS